MLFQSVFLIVVSCCALFISGCGSTQERADTSTGTGSVAVSDEAVYAKHATLRVDGLGCPMCAESIALLMGNIDAVTESRVDLSDGTVHIDLDPSVAVSSAELRQAIDDGGFTFRSIAFEK